MLEPFVGLWRRQGRDSEEDWKRVIYLFQAGDPVRGMMPVSAGVYIQSHRGRLEEWRLRFWGPSPDRVRTIEKARIEATQG